MFDRNGQNVPIGKIMNSDEQCQNKTKILKHKYNIPGVPPQIHRNCSKLFMYKMNKDSTHLCYFAIGNAMSSKGLAMNLVQNAFHGCNRSNFIFLKQGSFK